MNQCIHNIDLLRWMMGGQSVNVIEEWWFSDFLDNPEEVKAKFHENPPNVYGYGHTPLYADMINAIAARQQKQALELYYDLLALKEPPMRILFLIARQCNMLLQVKELSAKGFDNRTIASKIGVPPFVAGKYAGQAAKFKTAALRDAVEKCVEAEEAVKTGRMNDKMSVEILILSVL